MRGPDVISLPAASLVSVCVRGSTTKSKNATFICLVILAAICSRPGLNFFFRRLLITRHQIKLAVSREFARGWNGRTRPRIWQILSLNLLRSTHLSFVKFTSENAKCLVGEILSRIGAVANILFNLILKLYLSSSVQAFK